MGYFVKDDKYHAQFEKDFNNPIYHESIKTVDTTGILKYSVFTIGDSFSNQGGIGYINYLCMSDSTITLLNYEYSGKTIETLYGLINSHFFDRVSVEYVILESVERDFVFQSTVAIKNKQISFNEVISAARHIKKEKNYHFLNNAPCCVLRYNIMRHFKKQANVSHVYSFQTTDSLFTWKNTDEILIFANDLIRNPEITMNSVTELNNKLNELSSLLAEKNITLIVLPAPDKYTIYYDYIQDKAKFPQPKFFECMSKMEKKYIYIDAETILKKAVSSGTKDVYLAGDSHWSPMGSKMIAAEILSKISDSRE
jgi:hypothetical protein